MIEFKPYGTGKAKCAPNPDYPEGIDVDVSLGSEPACSTTLPYPAPECGVYIVECKLCRLRIAISSVGRPDDPRTLKMACDTKVLARAAAKA